MICGVAYGEARLGGIPFRSLPVTETHGQRLRTVTYPFWDEHHNKKLGRKPTRWRVRGVFEGPNFRDQIDAATRRWTSGDTLDFMEPTRNRTHRVDLAEDFKLDFNHQRLNAAEFTLDLVEAGGGPYPRSGAGAVVRSSVDELLAASASAYRASFGSFTEAEPALTAAEARAAQWARIYDFTVLPEFGP